MKDAIIGHTGFVGSNLVSQHQFEGKFNSKNIDDTKGLEVGELVCAGVSANKWQANKYPEQDLVSINSLKKSLLNISAKRFILISTIDVYSSTAGLSESFDCELDINHPYGVNRLNFEKYCSSLFEECYIIRLPGLFGQGLKKNIIYDLLNNNCLEMINPVSTFQFYSLNNLWVDIKKCISFEIRLMNLFTEPIQTREIVEKFFKGVHVGDAPNPVQDYNLYTEHAEVWGQSEQYCYTKSEVLAQLGTFIDSYKNK
jgi:hypothetical protein